MIIWPMAASLFYGLVCLILNALKMLDGPYFFLQVHEQPVRVIIVWFGIIAVLCLALSFLYYRIKWKAQKGKRN